MSICLHCLLLTSLWLNTVMHKQTLMAGPAEKLGVCLLACSLTETDAWELCGSPSQSFQLGTACQLIISTLYLHSLIGHRGDRNEQTCKNIYICNELYTMTSAVWYRRSVLFAKVCEWQLLQLCIKNSLLATQMQTIHPQLAPISSQFEVCLWITWTCSPNTSHYPSIPTRIGTPYS